MPSDFDSYPAAEIHEVLTYALLREKRRARDEEREEDEAARRKLDELRASNARESEDKNGF